MNTEYVEISCEGIEKSIHLFRDAGERECVLLWLGRREKGVEKIVDVYRPEQIGTVDYFEIPRNAMAALMTRLRVDGLYVVSQVHTHPEEAFHSHADDRWAIVRHVGALSIVLPRFARVTTVENFIRDGKVFALSRDNQWDENPSPCADSPLGDYVVRLTREQENRKMLAAILGIDEDEAGHRLDVMALITADPD